MRAVLALILLTLAWHPLAGIAIGTTAYASQHLTLTFTAAALVLLARHKPHYPHRIITALVGAGIATWITGHHADTTTLIKHSPAGPQIPAN